MIRQIGSKFYHAFAKSKRYFVLLSIFHIISKFFVFLQVTIAPLNEKAVLIYIYGTQVGDTYVYVLVGRSLLLILKICPCFCGLCRSFSYFSINKYSWMVGSLYDEDI